MEKSQNNKVLIFIDWYVPGFNSGGPVRTCLNLVAHLGKEINFKIVTRDRDIGENKSYKNVKRNQWNLMPDGSEVFYISAENLNYNTIKKIIVEENAGTIHINSLFSPYFTIVPLWILRITKHRSRVVVGPRGMFSSGALSLKTTKKKLFLGVAKIIGLFKNVIWHASTDVEKNEILSKMGSGINIEVAIDLAAPFHKENPRRIKEEGSLKLIFLGRVSRVKNLYFCLDVLNKLDLNKSQKIQFDIYGPLEDEEYWNECKIIISELPSNIKVQLYDPVPGDSVHAVLTNYHFLFLLTKNENYGHAIIESLLAGCPVLISDKTPWKQIPVSKAGWAFDLANQQQISNQIINILKMNQSEYNSISDSAFQFGLNIANDPNSIDSNRRLLTGLE